MIFLRTFQTCLASSCTFGCSSGASCTLAVQKVLDFLSGIVGVDAYFHDNQRMDQDSLRWLQNRLKIGPRYMQHAPRWLLNLQRWPQEGSQIISGYAERCPKTALGCQEMFQDLSSLKIASRNFLLLPLLLLLFAPAAPAASGPSTPLGLHILPLAFGFRGCSCLEFASEAVWGAPGTMFWRPKQEFVQGFLKMFMVFGLCPPYS